jgi:hypothetical protein
LTSFFKGLFKIPPKPEDPGIPVTGGGLSQENQLLELKNRKYEQDIQLWGIDVQVFWTKWIAVATILLVVTTALSLLTGCTKVPLRNFVAVEEDRSITVSESWTDHEQEGYENLTPKEREERAEYYRKFPPWLPSKRYKKFRVFWVGDYLYYHWSY